MCQCYPPSRREAPWSHGYYEPPHRGYIETLEDLERYNARYDKWLKEYHTAMHEKSAFIRDEIQRCAPENQPICAGCWHNFGGGEAGGA